LLYGYIAEERGVMLSRLHSERDYPNRSKWKYLKMYAERAPRQSEDRNLIKWLILVIVVGVIIRLLALPFSMTNEADAVSRTLIAWDWLSAPKLITSGVWGPLHTYIIALPMALTHDSIVAPILFHIFFSVITAIPLYYFTRNEFNNSRAGLFVAAAYMFYPIAVRSSLMATAEPPFGFFLALSLYFLSVARRPGGNWKHAIGGGLALMLAGMLRYEAWLLIPVMALSLYRKPRLMIPFVVSAIPFSIFWMLGNMAQYGDPLYSMHWASNWELVSNLAAQDMTTGELIKRITFYPLTLILGLTPLVGLLAVGGVILSVLKRRPTMIWILPLLAVMGLFVVTAAQGSLTLKGRYTITLAIFLLPFVAEVDNYLRLRAAAKAAPAATTSVRNNRYALGATNLAALAIIVTMLPLSYVGNVGPTALKKFYTTSINAVPRLDNADTMEPFSEFINAHLNHDTDGLITDFYRWETTSYVALMTRLPPDRIYFAPGQEVADIDVPAVSDFIDKHPTGLIILQDGSRFAKALNFNGDKITLPGKTVTLEMLDDVTSEQPNIAVYRYKLVATAQTELI
jgi:4-amino-4-deoxy-L-arabinose transferase-like glycosyltransferase